MEDKQKPESLDLDIEGKDEEMSLDEENSEKEDYELPDDPELLKSKLLEMEEYIQQLEVKVQEDEEVIMKLQNENEVEDNVGFIFEIHKNIAATSFYKDVVQDDPLLDHDVD